MDIAIHNSKKKVSVSDDAFGASFNETLVHQLVVSYMATARAGTKAQKNRSAVSGGGALPRHVDEPLLGVGLPLLNGYGLTETSPVVAVRLPERNQVGTIGPPLPRTECSIRPSRKSRSSSA